MSGQLRLFQREILFRNGSPSERSKAASLMPLTERIRATDPQQLEILKILWKRGGRTDAVSIGIGMHATSPFEAFFGQPEKAAKDIERIVFPRLRQLLNSELIASEKKGNVQTFILTLKGKAALISGDASLNERLSQMEQIFRSIQSMPLSEFEKKLLFATFADSTEQSNTSNSEYRLGLSRVFSGQRAVFQEKPVLYPGGWTDVEQLLHFPAKNFIMLDNRYSPEQLFEVSEAIAKRLEWYGCKVKEKNTGLKNLIVFSMNGEEKTLSFINADAVSFIRSYKPESFSAVVIKKSGGCGIGKAGLEKKLAESIAPGGFLLQSDFTHFLLQAPGMQKIAEGELSCHRAQDGGDYANYPSVLLQKPI